MTNPQYIFENNPEQAELERLRLIEVTHDPITFNLLNPLDLTGYRCLEVGAGAGSVAAWLGDRVGSRGTVTAVDINPRFIVSQDKVNVIQGDIIQLELEPNSYDLVHSRFVFIHIPQYQQALRNVIDALKPGGILLIEEPDFSISRLATGIETEDIETVARVVEASHQMFRQQGKNPFFGLSVPSLFQQAGLKQVRVQTFMPLAKGGENIVKIMKLSVQHLTETLISTGATTHQDIERFLELSDHPQAWFLHYAHISVMGKKDED